MNPRPIKVAVKDDYLLEVNFENGELRIFDMKPFLGFGVFKELNDVSYFKQVRVQNRAICWPNEQDICPDTLYLESIPYNSESP